MIRKMSGIRRNYIMPVLISGNKTAVSNVDKVEMLAETLIKVHSSDNLSIRARQCRSNTLALNPGINIRKSTITDDLDAPFSLFE